MKNTATHITFAHVQAFLDETRGQLTLGEIPPIQRAALAAVGKKVHVALLGRDGETMGSCSSASTPHWAR